ncbi:MAG: radical SAM protein [Deltaproteobacteria bacterium]|nr:radical SAM protein [Deltaproteobacteria bacterium]
MQPPLMLTWELTLRCNAKCIYCGSSAGAQRYGELTDQECFQLVDQIADLGVRFVILLGGEPFLRSSCLDIAAKLVERGIMISVITNGLLLDSEKALRLAALRPTGVAISIDGTKEVHDSMSGLRCFDKAVNGLRLLQQNDIISGIITTIINYNNTLTNLEALSEFVQRENLNAWKIQIGHPSGRLKKEDCLDAEGIYNLTKWVAGKKKELPFLSIGDEMGYCSSLEHELRGPDYCWQGCTAGTLHLGICANGSVKGCLAMSDEFSEGSIRERSLSEIWQSKGAFKYNREFDVTMLTGDCHNCASGNICKGGCRTFNYGYSGELYNYPYCSKRYEEQKRS